MSTPGKQTQNAMLYILARGATGLVSISTICVFTRLLNADEYGKLSLWISIITNGSFLFFQWISLAYSRLATISPRSEEQQIQQIAHRMVAASAAIATACTIVVLIAADQAIATINEAILILAGIVTMGLWTTHGQFAISKEQPLRFGALSLCRALLTPLIGIFLLACGFGIQGILAGVASASLFSVLIASDIRSHSSPCTSEDHRQFIRLGIPLSLASITAMIPHMADRLYINAYHGADAIAAYASSYELIQLSAGVLLNTVYISHWPQLAKSWDEKQTDSFKIYAQKLRITIFFLGLAVVTGACCFSDFFVFLLAKEIRTEAKQVIPLVAIVVFLAAIKAYIIDTPLLLRKKTRKLLVTGAIMATSSMVFYQLLIPGYSIVGSAISLLLTFSLGLAINTFTQWKELAELGITSSLLKSLSLLSIIFISSYLTPTFDSVTTSILVKTTEFFTLVVLIYLTFPVLHSTIHHTPNIKLG